MNIHLPSQLRWVTSLGGPLLLLPASVLKYWTGYQPTNHPAADCISPRWKGDPDGPVTDYDRACSVEGYLGLIDVGDAEGLVLGDEPNSTTWVSADGGGLLVRWVYAEDEDGVLRSLHELCDADFGKAELSLPVPTSPLLLFDSASPAGQELVEEALAIQMATGIYDVITADYRPNTQTQLIIHRLRHQ